jgi:hypothetical protein
VDPFSALVGGGAAGFFGAALAHLLTTFAVRLGSDSWLRGPYGPQFFNVALYTGVFYAAIGAAAGRRIKTAAIGFLGTFLGILFPMFILTRYGGWGMPRTETIVSPHWQSAVLGLYVLAIWGTIAGIGATAGRIAWWRGLGAAVLGSAVAYGVLTVLLRIFAAWAKSPWNPTSFVPSPVNLLDGLLSGAGLCLALALDERISRRKS